MPQIAVLHTYVPTATLTAAQLNSDFSAIRTTVNQYGMFVDVAATVLVTHVFQRTQTFTPSGGFGIAVTGGGISVVGDSSLVGALSGLTGLTVASGGVTVTAGGISITAGGLTVVAGGVAVAAGNLVMSGGQAVAKRVDDGDLGAAKAFDFNTGNVHRARLTAATCTLTFTNPAVGASYLLELLQDATGSRLISWPASVKWETSAPTLTTTANRKDFISLFWNGVVYVGAVFALNIADTT